jgi:hypothetical protein
MDHRPRKANVACPVRRVKHRPQPNGYALQFLLLISAVALLLGSIVAWKVYNNRRSWRDWSMSMRSGMLGMNGNRSGKGSSEDVEDELARKSIRYLGGGYADLGGFSIGRYDPITNTTLTVKFQLKGMTPYEDEESFNKFMHENERAFRDRVTEAVRDSRTSDYTDTASISKKVVARVNRAVSGRFLESVELAEFEVFESVGAYQAQPWQSGETAAARQKEEPRPGGR